MERVYSSPHAESRANIGVAICPLHSPVPMMRYREHDAEIAKLAVARVRLNEIVEVLDISCGEVDGQVVRLEV
jgi:hypothetical protein